MNLPSAPPTYSAADQTRLRASLARADAETLKRGRDILLQPGQRLVIPEETTGALYRVTVVAGVLTVEAL